MENSAEEEKKIIFWINISRGIYFSIHHASVARGLLIVSNVASREG